MAKQIKQTNNTNYSGSPLKPVAESYMSKINKPINTAIDKAKQEVSDDASTPNVDYKKGYTYAGKKPFNPKKNKSISNPKLDATIVEQEKPKVFDAKTGANSAASILAFTPGLGSLVKGAEFLGAAYKAAPLLTKLAIPAMATYGSAAITGLNNDIDNMKSYKEYKKKQQSTNDYLQELQIKDLK